MRSSARLADPNHLNRRLSGRRSRVGVRRGNDNRATHPDAPTGAGVFGVFAPCAGSFGARALARACPGLSRCVARARDLALALALAAAPLCAVAAPADVFAKAAATAPAAATQTSTQEASAAGHAPGTAPSTGGVVGQEDTAARADGTELALLRHRSPVDDEVSPGALPPVTVRCPFFHSWSKNERGVTLSNLSYVVEYTYEIARRANMRLEPVPRPTLADAMLVFETGGSDVFPIMYATPERERKWLFSKRPLDRFASVIFVRANDDRFPTEGPEDAKWLALAGAKVGVLADAPEGRPILDAMKKRGLAVTLESFANPEALRFALAEGQVDAASVAEYWSFDQARCMLHYDPRPVHFVVRKDRPDLMARVDAAMARLARENPDFVVGLHERYLVASSGDAVDSEESVRAFTSTLPPLRVAYEPRWAPLEFRDPATGNFSGIVADVFRQISESTGLRFEFVPMGDRDAVRAMRAGTIDMIACTVNDPSWVDRSNVVVTSPLLVAPMVLVRQRTEDPVRVVGMQRGFDVSPAIEERLGAKVLFYDDITLCAQALLDGRIDAVYTNIHNASLLQRMYPEFYLLSLADDMVALRAAVSMDVDPRVPVLVNRSLVNLSREEIDDVILDKVSQHKSTVREFIWNNFSAVSAAAGSVVLALVLLALYTVRERAAARARLEKQLYVDKLTGIGNANDFYRRGERVLARHPRDTFLLVFLDITDFRLVNDHFGFKAGDDTLRAFSRMLASWAEEGDVYARMGQDHFAVLTRLREWPVTWERLMALKLAFDDYGRRNQLDPAVRLIGGMCVLRDRSVPLDRRMGLAVSARNYTLENNRDFMLYNARVRKELLRRSTIENRLEHAVRNGEFVPWFQPKVNMITGRIVGSEALCRWLSPTEGLIPPFDFVPIFEQNGSIYRVDFAIYEAVCRALRSWLDKGWTVYPVSCNFSGISFKRAGFVQRVVETADHYGIPRKYIELELTETSVFANTRELNEKMEQLIAQGFHIAVDDFGYGYSSLGQLQHIRGHVLKLDRNFITQGLLTSQAHAVLTAVITLARTLGMDIVCEGVENAQQARALVHLGCSVAQGYYYSKPLPEKDFAALLATGKVFPRLEMDVCPTRDL